MYQRRKTEIKSEVFFPEVVAKKRRQVLLSSFIDSYLEESRVNKRSWRRDQQIAKRWNAPFPDRTLEEILPADIERWKRTRLDNGAAPATVNRELAFLKRVYNVALRDERTEKNPVAKVRLLPTNNARIRYLTSEEETTLQAVLPEPWWPLVEMALLTGLRRLQFREPRTRMVAMKTDGQADPVIRTFPSSRHQNRHQTLPHRDCASSR